MGEDDWLHLAGAGPHGATVYMKVSDTGPWEELGSLVADANVAYNLTEEAAAIAKAKEAHRQRLVAELDTQGIDFWRDTAVMFDMLSRQ